MSTSNDIAELLRKGIEAARENKRSDARGYFERVVELDEKNEKGWFWLASVVDSDDERRICLSNVLHINPNNERAKRALDALQTKAKTSKPAPVVDEQEVVAGVTRRQMTLLIGGGAAVVILILIVALVVITGNANRQRDIASTEQAVVLLQTGSALTAIAQAEEATATTIAETATQLALATPVPPTRDIPTLPPEWTPTPSPTAPATREALPLPVNLTGKLVVWGGQDMLANQYLPLGYFDFDFGMQYSRIGTSLGKHTVISSNGQRVGYTVYDDLLFSSSLEAINLNGTQKESLAERYRGQNVFEPQQPYFGAFAQSVVFIARTDQRNTTQVFLLNLVAGEGENPLRQLTDDEMIYTYPALSPDGTKIAVVRSDPNAATPIIDIINIDVSTGGKIAITNDGGSYVETSPRWTRDGSQVVFAAAPSNDPNNSDIYIKSGGGGGSALPLYRDPANDIFPVLSPDGRYIAFASNRDGAYDIFIFDQNDGTLSQLTFTPNEDDFPGDWWQVTS